MYSIDFKFELFINKSINFQNHPGKSISIVKYSFLFFFLSACLFEFVHMVNHKAIHILRL